MASSLIVPRHTGFDALKDLPKSPWGSLAHAYGTGVTGKQLHHDVQRSLASLADGVNAAATDALLANICHQGTVYEATAYAVPFLAAVAAGELDEEDRFDLVYLLAQIALAASEDAPDGSHAGAHGPGVGDQIRQAFQQSRAHLEAVVEHNDNLETLIDCIGHIAETPDARDALTDAIDETYGDANEEKESPEDIAERQARRKQGLQTLPRLEVGAQVDGTVSDVTEYGVFVDLGGIKGLLHNLDMGTAPRTRFAVGENVRVFVKTLNREMERVRLSLALLLLALVLAACSAPSIAPDAGETPLFEDGFIVPDDSIPCTPSDGGPAQNDCNHHGSSVAELKDGTIAISWFHGIAEKSPDSRILWSKKKGSGAWSAPAILYDDPALSEGNSTLWVHENGDLLLFFVNIVGNGWAEARMRLIRSKDDGTTWSAPVTLEDSNCWMLRYPPVRLKSGELFLPAYYECLALPVFVRSKDDFATWKVEEKWKEGNWLLDHVGAIQPSLVRLANDDLSIICRDGTQRHRITRSTSGPDGKTWTPGVALALPNPGAAAAQVRLANGHVVVIFDNSPTLRSPIAAALSEDDGKTFVAIRTIRAGDCADDECSYPAVAQAKDGSIWVSYTHNRKTIGWAHFNEAWVRAGTDVANITCLLDEACRDGQCYPACTGPAGCSGGASCVDGACRTACDGGLCVGKVLARCQ